MLGLHPYFDTRHNWEGRAVSPTLRPHFIPKKIPWYSFLLQAERTPRLLNADRRIGLFKISKDRRWNGTRSLHSCGTAPQPTAPLTRVGVSTNCTAHTCWRPNQLHHSRVGAPTNCTAHTCWCPNQLHRSHVLVPQPTALLTRVGASNNCTAHTCWYMYIKWNYSVNHCFQQNRKFMLTVVDLA
jgi:hypothetical protein